MADSKYPHSNHRQRVRAEIRKSGCENLTDAALLELLLFYSVPRKDTKPIAVALLEKYGSLEAVLSAPAEEIAEIGGIGESSSLLISASGEICRRIKTGKSPQTELARSGEINERIYKELAGRQSEAFYVASLNAVGIMTAGKVIAEGDSSRVTADNRAILEFAFSNDADSIIIAHNHPNAEAAPSAEDIELTREIAAIANRTGIKLADHVIVGSDGYLSLASTEKFAYIFDKSSRVTV